MNYILCRNRVRNFDYWKGVFDSRADAHREAGLKLIHLWYELESPRNIFFLFEAEDMQRARAFLDSDLTTAERQSGLIEGDFRFFSPSLSYGVLNEAESHAFTEATESVAAKDAKELSSVQAMDGSVPPEPVQSAQPEVTAQPGQDGEPEKIAEPEKTPEPVKSAEPEQVAEPERTAEPEKTTEPAKKPTSLPAMKGPERVKSPTPAEPFEGWAPVENWPPAEAAADATPERAPQEARPRGRWVRMKY